MKTSSLSCFVRSAVFISGAVLSTIFISASIPAQAAPANGLSENASREIASVLAEKASWTPVQAKMESQLIHALKKHRGQPFAAGAPNLRMDVKPQADGRILVDIKASVTPGLLNQVTNGGGTVINQFPEYQSVRALVALDELETLAGLSEVITIRRAAEGHTWTGAVDSEGDATHLAAAARAAFGVTGAGVKVGVLSDSDTYLSTAKSTGDLGTVTVPSGQGGSGTGEGTAMLEIVHDLAPGATLYFATAAGGESSFAKNIKTLFSDGCTIIVDDEYYLDESPFQDGVIAQAIDQVTAGGALYFSAAGNSGNLDSGTSGTWEGDFVDGGPATSPISEAGRIHSFGPLTYNTVAQGGSQLGLDLFWADPLGASTNDYDVFVLDSTGSTVVASSTTRQTGTQNPYETTSINPGERIVIVKFSGAARFLHLDTGRGQLTIATTGATSGHAASASAFGVAAVDVATAYPNAFTGGSTNPVEVFSSDGPRHVFFNTNGSAITPGNFSSTGGMILQKPDLTAADGVSTSLTNTANTFSPFFGTSAAAPHAASIAALLKSYNPALTPAEIRAILTSTALDIMAAGVDRDSGYGIVMANLALQAAPPDGLLITPGIGFTASGLAGGPFSNATWNFSLTNIGIGSFNWNLGNTSTWLTVSPTNGTLTSNGSPVTVTASLNSAASNLTAGTYIATIRFTNQTTLLGQSRTVTLVVSAPPIASAYASNILALSPIAYWRLNETNPPPAAAVASNSSSLGASLTGYGFSGALSGQPGIVGTSYQFANTNLSVGYFGSHVDVPYTAALNPNGPFSVELWAKPALPTPDLFCPAASIDLSQNTGASREGWVFYQNSNSTWQFRIGGFSGYSATLTGGTVSTNSWQHLVGVYDGANASLYVNGALVAGPTTASGFSPNTTVAFRIGATTIPNRTFNGLVDEVAFYNTALSASVIASHYNAATTNNSGYGTLVLASSPVGYWRLDDAANSAIGPNGLPMALNIGTIAPQANGTYEPNSIPGVPGVPDYGFGVSNSACRFSPPGYIDVPLDFLDIYGPLTVSAWIRAAAAGAAQSIVDRGVGSYRLYLDGAGDPHFTDGAQTVGDLVGPNPVTDGQWHHLVGTFDGDNTETLYVDAQTVASATGASTSVLGNSVNDLWIGGDPDSGAFQFFNGTVDEVAIFTNALSSAQIQQLYTSATNSPPPTAVPPKFTVVKQSAPNTLSLTWTATAGQMYQVQYKTDLTQTNWINLNTALTAAGSTVTATDNTTTNSQRFYRIILVP